MIAAVGRDSALAPSRANSPARLDNLLNLVAGSVSFL
jgi:hypothetical protein